jgi:hypothetical protein
MTTIAMQTGFPGSGNGTAHLPGGSQAYTVAGGIAQVQPVDVPAALASGWTFSGGAAAAYAAVSVRAMAPPSSSVLANGATVTFPDGNTAVLTAGVLQVPLQYVALMTEQRWTLVGAFANA